MALVDLIAEHVTDSTEFVLPFVAVHLPRVFGFQLTRFMVLEVLAGCLMCAMFIPLARRLSRDELPRGRFWNMCEAVLLFLRDEVARPAVGRHEADRYLPFVWTLFFFVLFCNLLGILPWMGSPTGALTVTLALAAMTFLVVVGSGMAKFGPWGFCKSLLPPMEAGRLLGAILAPMILGIELLGLVIRHLVLAVRLLANMFAGHLVLGVIVSFIACTAPAALALWLGVTLPSVLGAAALTMLELFVAFLQAYIFVFLSALFIGMAVHPH